MRKSWPLARSADRTKMGDAGSGSGMTVENSQSFKSHHGADHFVFRHITSLSCTLSELLLTSLEPIIDPSPYEV